MKKKCAIRLFVMDSTFKSYVYNGYCFNFSFSVRGKIIMKLARKESDVHDTPTLCVFVGVSL